MGKPTGCYFIRRKKIKMKPVRSVERAISILFLVAQSDAPLGLSEISRSIGLDKATSLRLLSTLGNAKLVQQDPVSRRYIPGSNISKLYSTWRSDIRNIAKPYLEILQRKTEETVCLVCPRGMERVNIEVLRSTHELAVVPVIGSSVPIYSGASGRVFMAYLPEVECARIIKQTSLQPVTAHSVSDTYQFMKYLEKVRTNGYAQTTAEVTPHSSSIAGPIFNSAGEIVATIVVRGPVARMTVQRGSEIAPLIVEVARQISEELGGDQGKTPAKAG
jgi:IclR family KDG regulon transcriptional repressor